MREDVFQKSKNSYSSITSRKIYLLILAGLVLVVLAGFGFIFYKIKIAPMIPKSAVITKQVSGAVTGYKNIKWVKVVKLSNLKEGQKYLKMPKSALNTSFSKIDRSQAVAFLGIPKEESSLALQDRQVLAGLSLANLAHNSSSQTRGLIPRALFDVETKIADAIGNNGQENQNIDITPYVSQEVIETSDAAITAPDQENKDEKTEEKDEKETSENENQQVGEQGQSNENQEDQGQSEEEIQTPTDESSKESNDDKEDKSNDEDKGNSEEVSDGSGSRGSQTSEEAPIKIEGEEFLLVEYETPAPTIQEELSEDGKTIVVSLNNIEESVSDVVIFVPLSDEDGVKSLSQVEIEDEEGKDVNKKGEDLDGDGNIDYVEWTEKKLENEEEFKMSFVSRALLFDSDGTFLENIYDKVAENDNNYIHVGDSQYISLTFLDPLGPEKYIALYAKSLNSTKPASVKIYQKGSNKLIATISNIKEEGIYKADLQNIKELSGNWISRTTEGIIDSISNIFGAGNSQGENSDNIESTETIEDGLPPSVIGGVKEFDLRFQGEVEVDYFVDPSTSDVISSDHWVLTPLGPKDMVDIKVGDEVIGYDFKTNKKVTNNITKIQTVNPNAYGYWEQDEEGNNTNYVLPPFVYYLINGKYKLYKNQSLWVNQSSNKLKTRVVHAFEIEKGNIIYSDSQGEILVESIEEITTESQWTEFSVSGNHTYMADGLTVHNGSRYWVGGGADASWDATGNTNWGSASNTQDNASVPTSSDDVFFDGVGVGASNSTLDAAITIRSLNMTGYANTFTHNSAITLSIGDATAGSGNVALTMVAGMTYTLGSATTSAISFTSTSTTAQAVDFAGKTSGNVTYNGVAGSWQMTGTHNTGTAATVTLTNGTLDVNGQTVSWGTLSSSNSNTRTLTLGAAAISLSVAGNGWNVATTTNLTFNANTSTITLSGSDAGMFGGGLTYNNVVFSGAATQRIHDSNTFANLTKTGTAAKTNAFRLAGNQTITGTLTINGNSSTNRMLVHSVTIGTAITLTAATVTVTNADFKDITGAGAGSWNLSAITGGSGDGGGNTNITFTTATTNYWVGGTGNWSTVAEWASSSGGAASSGRVPLPQDDAIFDANSFSAGSLTVTQDMPRAGKNINWTGVTNTPTWTTNIGSSVFGSLTLVSGMTLTASTAAYVFEGRSTYTLTNAGKTWAKSITIDAPGGTLTLQDALTMGATNTLTLTNGTFDANNFNVTVGIFASSNSNTRTITMGSGTWELTLATASTAWSLFTTTNLTLNANTSTIKITDTSTAAIIFSGGSKTYNNIWWARGSSTGSNTIVGSNTFADFKDDGSAAHSILFTAGITTTVTTFTVSGTVGNEITINSTTTGTHDLVKAGGGIISRDYLNIQHSVATPSDTWYAGTNSTNNQATETAGSGWIFSAPTNCTSLATGNWNTAGTWDCGHVPTTADTVTVATGHTVTMNVDSAVLGTITISGTLNTSDGTSRSLSGTTLTIASGGTLTANASTITLSGTGTVFSNSGTYTAGTSTISITDTSSTSKTFAGGGGTYNILSITGSGTGAVILTGSNTFADFTINAPKTITFPSSATQTISGTFTCTGTAGNVITINSSSAGTAATLSKSSGTVSCDYLSLQDSAATGGATWNPGTNSTDVSGNSGWLFNVAPSFTAGPSDGSSASSTPNNAESNVTFTATATDSNSDNYYLAVCKTSAVTAVNNGAPTCDGGSWAISSSTVSGAEASVTYATLTGDSESNIWYAFVCDHDAASLCSSASQGSGDSGSPFKVNHKPSFSAVSYTGSNFGAGANVEFTATASDADTDGTNDTVTFYLCKSNDFTGTVCGSAGEWCSSSASASNPSCTYTVQVSDGNGSKNYYGYIIDNHNFASTSNPVSGSFTTQASGGLVPRRAANVGDVYIEPPVEIEPELEPSVQEEPEPSVQEEPAPEESVSEPSTQEPLPPTSPITKIVEEVNKIQEQFKDLVFPEKEVVLPPAEQFVSRETPNPLSGQWDLLSVNQIREFVLTPLPDPLFGIAEKFPKFGLVLTKLGIEKMTELEKLRNVKLILPGINETIGISQSQQIVKLTDLQIQKLPEEIVFIKAENGLIDISPEISVTKEGEIDQTIEVTSGKSIELIVKPAHLVQSIKGYLVFISRSQISHNESQNNGFLISFASAQEFQPEKRLVLQEFLYQEDKDNPGIYKASVDMPQDYGEYKIITEINYKDKQLAKKEIEMVTVIDPEGYVYKRIGENKLPLKNAKVTLYWLDPSIKQYQPWPAEKYSQENPQLTDERGNYSFLVPEGSYYVQVEMSGYLPYQSESFQVREGKGVRFNIELTAKYWWLRIVNWEAILLGAILIALILNFFKGRLIKLFQRRDSLKFKNV